MSTFWDRMTANRDFTEIHFFRGTDLVIRHDVDATVQHALGEMDPCLATECTECFQDGVMNVIHGENVVHMSEDLSRVLSVHDLNRFSGIDQFMGLNTVLELDHDMNYLMVVNVWDHRIIHSFNIGELEWAQRVIHLDEPYGGQYSVYAIECPSWQVELHVDLDNDRILDMFDQTQLLAPSPEPQLPLVVLEAHSGLAEGECSICQTRFLESDLVSTLACAHPFHLDCIATWFSQASSQSRCPLCRTQHQHQSAASVAPGASANASAPSS